MTERNSQSAPLCPTLSPRFRGEREQRSSTPFPPRSGGRAGEGGQTVNGQGARWARLASIDIRARRSEIGGKGRGRGADGERARRSLGTARLDRHSRSAIRDRGEGP